MKYSVPLFIEREARITPGLTFKQLIILLLAGALSYLCFRVFPGPLKWLFAFPIFALGIFLSFFKIEGMSPLKVITHFLDYLLQARIYVWEKEKEVVGYKEEEFKVVKVKKRKESAEEKIEILEKKESSLSNLKLKLDLKTK